LDVPKWKRDFTIPHSMLKGFVTNETMIFKKRKLKSKRNLTGGIQWRMGLGVSGSFDVVALLFPCCFMQLSTSFFLAFLLKRKLNLMLRGIIKEFHPPNPDTAWNENPFHCFCP